MTEAIKKMKQRKAGGPPGVMVKMIKAGGRKTVTALSELVSLIIYKENIPEGWKDSFIINCYKGNGDATDRRNYTGLKLLEQVMKVLEYVLESFICSQVDINYIEFGFRPRCSTADEIYILQQMQRNTSLGRRKSTSLLLT